MRTGISRRARGISARPYDRGHRRSCRRAKREGGDRFLIRSASQPGFGFLGCRDSAFYARRGEGAFLIGSCQHFRQRLPSALFLHLQQMSGSSDAPSMISPSSATDAPQRRRSG